MKIEFETAVIIWLEMGTDIELLRLIWHVVYIVKARRPQTSYCREYFLGKRSRSVESNRIF